MECVRLVLEWTMARRQIGGELPSRLILRRYTEPVTVLEEEEEAEAGDEDEDVEEAMGVTVEEESDAGSVRR